jgi:WD40 repeat protein
VKHALLALLWIGCSPRSPSTTSATPAAPAAWTLGEPARLGAPVPIHGRPIIALAADPAGAVVVSASEAPDAHERELGEAGEPGVHVWELATGRLRARLGDAAVRAMAATEDASIVAALDPAGTVVMWTVATGARRGQLTVGDGVVWIGVDARAATLYTVDRGGRVASWSVASTKRVKLVETGVEARAVAGTSRGVIAVGGVDGALAIVDLAANAAPVRIGAHLDDIAALDLSADGKLVVAVDEGRGWVFDVASRKPEAAFAHGGQAVLLLANGKGVVVSSPTQGQELQLIELPTGEATVLERVGGHARALVELPGGRIAAGTYGGPIRTFDLATGHDVQAGRGPVAAIHALMFEPEGAVIASAGAFAPQGTLRWSAVDRDPAPFGLVLAGSPSGRLRAEHRSAGAGELAVVGAGKRLTWPFEYAPSHVAISGDERTLIGTVEGDEMNTTHVVVFDLATGAPPRTWPVIEPAFIQQVGISPDGAVIAVGGATIALFDRASGARTRTLVADTLNVAALVFTDAGKRLVTASESDGLQIWDAITGALVRTLAPGEQRQGSGDTAYCAAVSPDGTLIASGHRHGSVKLWDAATGRLLVSVPEHRGLVLHAAFSPDGARLATGDMHGQIRVWPVIRRGILTDHDVAPDRRRSVPVQPGHPLPAP